MRPEVAVQNPPDQSDPGHDAGPPVVFCPQCEMRVLSIKSLKISALQSAAEVEYVCEQCGLETTEPFRLQA
jgi:DNA-directed RNA polymerase subunit RPC12/RpoP